MKILILVGSAGRNPWLKIEKSGQMQTFAQESMTGVDVLWAQGSADLDRRLLLRSIDKYMERRFELFHPERRVRGWNSVTRFPYRLHTWLLNKFLRASFFFMGGVRSSDQAQRVEFRFPTLYFLHPYRALLNLEYALRNFDFDYLLKTTSTCYVDLAALVGYLEDAPNQRFYSGEVYSKRGVEFVSGAGTLMSRDVVELVVQNASELRLDVHDDVGLGDLIARQSEVKPFFYARIDVAKTSTRGLVMAATASPPPYLYRCKVADGETDAADPVIELMKQVHGKLLSFR